MAETFLAHPIYELTIGSNGTIIGPKGWPLKHRVSKCGYSRVVAYIDRKQKHLLVHRLVAEMFLPGRKEQINHKDGNKLNNNIDNLEWCTRSHNIIHAYKHGLIDSRKHKGHKRSVGEKNGNAKLTPCNVQEIRSKYSIKYNRKEKPWEKYGVCEIMFRNVIRRSNWKEI